ncbi:hypothetical protein EV356DRAFT_501530 [Viridothelium virens]|uniref:Apple domain-containing protein n=1 Tax=Viridothelium virens TaxID=1048519 RepID=A0A6A6H9W0_VIRVR|nr:hypothetical protein EV356DRAFT_501530 [Viridothelium virens]
MMRASLLFSLAVSGVHALVFPRQGTCAADACQQALQSVSTASSDCAAFMDPTVTSTNGYTFVTGVNSQITYSTSLVTAFALSPAPTAGAARRRQASSPSPLDNYTVSTSATAGHAAAATPVPTYASAACGSDPTAYASACGCAFSLTATTKTNKIFTATATETSTYTYSEVAQATQTLAACDASASYGYFQGSIVWNSEFDGGDVGFQVGQPHQLIFPNSTMEGCCLQCYQLESAGCLQYQFTPENSTCALMVNDGACPDTPEGRLQVLLYPNDEKPLVGVGTCDVEVQNLNG